MTDGLSENRDSAGPQAQASVAVNLRNSAVRNVFDPRLTMELLEWDSTFFGFRVARHVVAAGDLSSVGDELQDSKRHGVRLVYVFDGTGSTTVQAEVERLGGRLVDRRVTYELPLDAVHSAKLDLPDGIDIRAYSERTVGPELCVLALAAGEYSRFRVDPQMPDGAFERMYQLWIERSVSGEIADTVLVATGRQSELSGLVTVACRGSGAVIGLVAVAAAARGKGIGRALMSAAHGWMRDTGSTVSSVMTQAENAAACRLYESCGYRPVSREHIYHVWLPTDAG